MTIREMFQKIEKAGFADVEITRNGDGIQIQDDYGDWSFICSVYKDIDPKTHSIIYNLDLETGEQCVEEMKADGDRGDFKLVGRTYLDNEGNPITNKQRLEETQNG